MDTIVFLIGIGVFSYGVYQAYLRYYLPRWRPDEYAAMKQREEEARRAEQKKAAVKVATGLVNALLAAVFKRR